MPEGFEEVGLALAEPLEGLARIYKELKSRKDLHRAYMLLVMLETLQPDLKYTDKYWERRLMVFEIWFLEGSVFKEKDKLESIKQKYKEYNSLGLLDGNDLKPRFTEIFDEAMKIH